MLAHPNVKAMEPTDCRIELMRLSAITLQESQGGPTAIPVLDEADQLITRSTRPDYWDTRLRSIREGYLTTRAREDALAMSERAEEIAAACGDAFNELQNRLSTVNMLLDLGRLPDADQLAARVIAACTADARWIGYFARKNRAVVAVERGDRALCAATARRLLAEADGLGQAVDAEYLLTLADPVKYAPQINARSRSILATRPSG